MHMPRRCQNQNTKSMERYLSAWIQMELRSKTHRLSLCVFIEINCAGGIPTQQVMVLQSLRLTPGQLCTLQDELTCLGSSSTQIQPD